MSAEQELLAAAHDRVRRLRSERADSRSLAIALEELARLERRAGLLEHARTNGEEALRLYERTAGDSLDVASCLHTLANIYIEAEDWDAAHAVLDRALDLTDLPAHAHDLRSWAAVRYTFASFLLLAEESDHVLTVMDDIVGRLGAARPTSRDEALFLNSTLAKSYNLGASALIQVGRSKDAITLLQRALPFFEAAYPPGDRELNDFLTECVEYCRSVGDGIAARTFELRAREA